MTSEHTILTSLLFTHPMKTSNPCSETAGGCQPNQHCFLCVNIDNEAQTFKNIQHQEHQPSAQGNRQRLATPYGVAPDSETVEPSSYAYKKTEKTNVMQHAAGIQSWPGTIYSDPRIANLEDKFQGIMKTIKETVISRGIRGLLGLARLFRIMDIDNSQTLNYYEFTKVFNDARLHFDDDDTQVVFNFFDRRRDGHIQYSELLNAIRGFMPEYRQSLAAKAFDQLMQEKTSGPLTLEDIRVRFNAEHHPDYEGGRKSQEQATNEFLEAFESHHVYFVKAV